MSATHTATLHGEVEQLSGFDLARCKSVLKWLVGEGAIQATVTLSAAPHVVTVHRSGYVTSSGRALLAEIEEQS
jgi:hypothetical protein